MATRVAQHVFTGTTTPYSAYDSTKTVLGDLIQQRTGATGLDKFAGPMPIGLARPMEASTAIASAFPHVIQYDTNNFWVFLADIATAAATRRISLFTFDRTTSVFNWLGFITLTLPAATAHTIRGFRMSRELYTTGTAAVSGTAVTGTGTAWSASRIPVGCRIGFGSTNPTAITTWYEISAIGSDTGITLSASAGTVADGPYVIEDLRALISTTNATLTNGGVFMAKGLRFESFNPSGTTIAAAVTTDNVRAAYWLADAATVTNTIACGLAIDDKVSWTEQYIYVIDGTTTTCRVYKYNIRASLSDLASGKSVLAYSLVTPAKTPTGTVSQANNGRIGSLNHEPDAGTKFLYFVTTTRVYRALVSGITAINSEWQTDAMVEVPPGGTTTYAVTSALSSVEIASTIDRLIVASSGAAGVRSYVTKYNTVSNPFDHIFLVDDKQYDQSSSDSGAVPHPTIIASIMSIWSEAGILFLCRNGTTAALNQLYALPASAHWTYANGSPPQRLVTPSLATTNAASLTRAFVNASVQMGSGTVGLPAEPHRVYYRIDGIADDSGTWIAFTDDTLSLDGVTPSSAIQLMFEFKVLGGYCIPGRLYSCGVIYEDLTTDSHYQPSVAHSDRTNKRFAWRFSTAFGSTVPTMRVRLYDAITGGLLVDDNTASPTGTFEKSTNDGSSWGAYNTTDKANETTYIRYTPASLGDDIKVRALLTTNA